MFLGVGVVVAFALGFLYRKKSAEQNIGSAENEAARIINDALKDAESKKKEIVLEGREEVLKFKGETEKELSERRKDVQRLERRVQQKEENLDKKMDSLENKEKSLESKSKSVEEKLREAEAVKKSQFDMLERISGFTAKQAKEYLLESLQDELVHEKAVKISLYEQKLKEESDKIARNILSLAIQRCAADHVAEATISVVPLPNDDMKGRIIGREGRNIRAIENLTGVDLIIDEIGRAHV